MSTILYHCRQCAVILTDPPEPVQSVDGRTITCPECGTVTTYRRRDLDQDLVDKAFRLEVI